MQRSWGKDARFRSLKGARGKETRMWLDGVKLERTSQDKLCFFLFYRNFLGFPSGRTVLFFENK
jgi:hypothetical protein